MTLTRAEGLSEAANLYGYLMETDETHPWTVVTDVSHDGVSCVRSGDGRALQVWQDYVAGTDPTNAASMFTAGIEIRDGIPQVTWSPNLNTNGVVRSYTVWGKTNLTDAAWHSPTNAADRFFKVSVEMP